MKYVNSNQVCIYCLFYYENLAKTALGMSRIRPADTF